MSDYKKLTDELGAILEQLQSGDLPLDSAIEQYEEGMKLIKKMETQLKTAENKITKIKSSYGVGK